MGIHLVVFDWLVTGEHSGRSNSVMQSVEAKPDPRSAGRGAAEGVLARVLAKVLFFLRLSPRKCPRQYLWQHACQHPPFLPALLPALLGVPPKLNPVFVGERVVAHRIPVLLVISALSASPALNLNPSTCPRHSHDLRRFVKPCIKNTRKFNFVPGCRRSGS